MMLEDDASTVEIGNGFALDEYSAAPHGLPTTVRGGTMPKAVNPPGGILDKLVQKGEQAPGPGYYFKGVIEKNFVQSARGGTFSKLARVAMGKSSAKSPSVGQYETVNSQVTTRTRGGLMSKNDRINIFAKMAERTNAWNSNGPGKYNAVRPEKHKPSLSFASPRTESRTPRKGPSVGPGYYNINYTHTEGRPASYSGSREETGKFMARMNNDRNATPFPWYKDMPDSKIVDKTGRQKHCKMLLKDRKVTPRKSRSYEVTSPCEVALEMDTTVPLPSLTA